MLPPPRVRTIDLDPRIRGERGEAADDALRCALPLDARLGDDQGHCGEARTDGSDHVPARGAVRAREHADHPGHARERPLPPLVEQALRSELSLEPLQAHEQVSCADPLDRRGPEDELSALLPEVEVTARLDALPVEELEPGRVVPTARHLHPRATRRSDP